MSDDEPSKINPFWSQHLRHPKETMDILSRPTKGVKPTRFPNLEFAKLLKEYRIYRNLSQSKLADLSGFDHSWTSRLEAGKQTPSRESVMQLAKGLGFTEDDARTTRLLLAAGYAVEELNLIFSCMEISELDMVYLDASPEVQEVARMFIADIVKWIHDLSDREKRR